MNAMPWVSWSSEIILVGKITRISEDILQPSNSSDKSENLGRWKLSFASRVSTTRKIEQKYGVFQNAETSRWGNGTWGKLVESCKCIQSWQRPKLDFVKAQLLRAWSISSKIRSQQSRSQDRTQEKLKSYRTLSTSTKF